ncbi:hypothetical protein ACGFXC_09075 [Streptomyces sp. NPDC048507]|uniref:hypothetical protein n=1 Tax=Streptomyces sp. NPDC048507 TaxID=3365560 RepID=UPI00371391D0
MAEQHEPEPFYENADACPHPEPNNETDPDGWDSWCDQHPACDDGHLCLGKPVGPGCSACSTEAGEMVPWSQCRTRDHARPKDGVVPNPGIDHQPVTVWVGSLDCLERECDEYVDEDGEDIATVDRCSHIREEQACSCQRQDSGEYSTNPCPALIPSA